MSMTGKEFIKSKGWANCDFMDSGIADTMAELCDEFYALKTKKPEFTGRITKKMKEAERFVDTFTSVNGCPPTYIDVARRFALKSTCASYARLRHCRHKMITIQKSDKPKN